MGLSARLGMSFAMSLNGLGLGGEVNMFEKLSLLTLGAGIMLLGISLTGNYFQYQQAQGCFIMPSAVPPISISKSIDY